MIYTSKDTALLRSVPLSLAEKAIIWAVRIGLVGGGAGRGWLPDTINCNLTIL